MTPDTPRRSPRADSRGRATAGVGARRARRVPGRRRLDGPPGGAATSSQGRRPRGSRLPASPSRRPHHRPRRRLRRDRRQGAPCYHRLRAGPGSTHEQGREERGGGRARLPDGATVMVSGFGLCGIPENLIAGPARPRGEEPHDRLEQRGRHRLRGQLPAAERAGPQDGRDLRRREQGLRGMFLDGSLEVELTRRAPSPSGSARAGPASRPSSPPPATVRWSPRARRCAGSPASPT